ncbi:MAG: alanine--glyoxylate aminotransferase family protein [Rhodobacteraceae bacterium]|nr:alanine--glyoxylate aminotransferase family protein [Paracoccaceae bacterium]
MTLANGRTYLAIPGPSVMPDRVLQAMHRAAPNIYEGELHDLTRAVVEDLKKVADTRHQAAIYIANGHGVWEAAVANVFSRGDKALVLGTGRFAQGWGEVARRMGVEVELIDFGRRAPIDPTKLTEALAADRDHRIKAVMCVQVDTASSVRNDIPVLRRVLDEAGHPALFMVDCIASLACDEFHMDDWGVDVMVSASQKGLMTPPGLGFVFYNDKADKARDTADLASFYWDWRPRAEPQVYYQYFAGTAPTHHLFGLREALDMIAEETLPTIWARHSALARAIWAACEAWGAEGPLELNISDPALRSHAVTALRIGAPHGTALRHWLIENAGVTLGIGLGMETEEDPRGDGFFRIGHMGHVNAHMVMGVLGAIQSGLTALNIPHGRGALDAAAEVLARP